jgi:MoaA/NifB/PqqE/SkfB family radical SAM enzyme
MPNHHDTNNFKKIISTNSCHLPWTNLRISPQGNFTPCCSYSGTYKNEKGEPYNFNKDDISDVINSKYLNKLKKDLIDNKYPAGCNKCWRREKINSPSQRINAWHDDYLKGQYAIKKNKKFFLSLHIDWSNKCNLKCRICNFTASTKWGNELIKNSKIYKINVNTIKDYNNEKADWDKNEIKIKNNILPLLPNLASITNTGGEPLLSKSHEKFLELIIAEGYSNKISLFYNTNGTKYPERLVNELWPRFKEIKIRFSIDDIEKRFEYQRHPANWKEVLENMKKFKNNNLENLKLEIYSVISIFNILYVEELYEFVKIFGATYWNIDILDYPDEFSINHLPKNFKLLLVNKYNKIKDDTEIQKIVNELQASHAKDYHWKKRFIHKIKITDKVRKENFAKTFPEMDKLIHKYY